MTKVFKTHRTVKFSDCDPAGIMFFGNIFCWAHDGFENWLVEAGFQWKDWFKNTDYVVPIRHSSADHSQILKPGETYEIQAQVKAFGTTSMTLKYIFLSSASGHATVHAKVEMVHVFLESKTHKPIPIPEIVRQKLSPYLESV